MFTVQEVLNNFPAPTYRPYQRNTIIRIAELFNSGVKVILLDAPCGSGKSYINTTFCRSFESSFYTTPQLTLIDQILRDKYIGKYFVEIKGRQNYYCPYDFEATVDIGRCVRDSKFECEKSKYCPYWRQKMKAIKSHNILCSFAYLILEGKTEGHVPPFLGEREFLVLDESHSIDRYIIEQVDLDISPWNLTESIYKRIKDVLGKIESMKDLKNLVHAINLMIDGELNRIQLTFEGKELSLTDARIKNKLEEFKSTSEFFLNSDKEWVVQEGWTTYKNERVRTIKILPLFAREFSPDLVWDKAKYFIVSSATILDPKTFVYENGLDKVFKGDEIRHIKVPSTFPPENRPIVPMWKATGRMSKNNIDENLPKAVSVLKAIMRNEGENRKAAVHCHSYEIANKFIEECKKDEELRDKIESGDIITHNSEDRKGKLEEWIRSKGKIFICVAFEEGQDWKGEICDYQVLLKVPFMDLEDKRVARRLELKNWRWYYLEALKETIQAYGRAIRSAEDKKKFYVLDESFVNLIRRTKKYIPDWFLKVIPKEVI
jgi:Rad3-related DNA helicase